MIKLKWIKTDAKKIVKFIKENYQDTLNKIQIDLYSNSGNDWIEVIDKTDTYVYSFYKQFFVPYMEDLGYCNRDKYNTYKAEDVLAFILCVNSGLLQNSYEVREMNEIFKL